MIQFFAGMMMGWILSHPAVRTFFAMKFAEWLAAIRARMGSK